MSIADTRQELAGALTEALTGLKIHPYRPAGLRTFSGYLQLTAIDTTECTFGEVRTSFEVVVPVAADQATFEKMFDLYGGPLVTACNALGQGVTLRPYTEIIDAANLLCIVATLITESENL